MRSPVSPFGLRGSSPRWFVAAAPALQESLRPLADERHAEGWHVVWLDGAKAIALTEQLSRYNAGGVRGDSLLLVGSPSDWPNTEPRFRQVGGFGSTGRMNGLASDAAINAVWPTLAVGRLPARSRAELKIMISKILGYENGGRESAGQRKAVCIISNPIAGSDGTWLADRLAASLSKRAIQRIGSHWKAYGTADIRDHPFSLGRADFAAASHSAISGSYDLLLYFGHSDEELLFSRRSVIPAANYWRALPASGEKGLFFTGGCTAFADAESYAACAIRSAGGPAASIGPSGKTYAAFAYLAGRAMVDSTKSTSPKTVGAWWLAVQKQISAGKIHPGMFRLLDHFDGSNGKISLADQRKENLEMWHLYGDPAMPFPP